jgi:hypothetical protein
LKSPYFLELEHSYSRDIYLIDKLLNSSFITSSHRGGSGSSPSQVMRDLWWKKWDCGRFFSEYFCFPCQFSFHRLLHTHLSSGAGAISHIMTDLSSRLKPHTTPKYLKKNHNDDSSTCIPIRCLANTRVQLWVLVTVVENSKCRH